jgi:hypothetical protein
MPYNERKYVFIDASDMTGGLANAYPPHSIADKQVADILNALIEEKGFTRSSGYKGYQPTPIFTGTPSSTITGLFHWIVPNGKEIFIVVANRGKVYQATFDNDAGTVSLSAPLYDLDDDSQCTATNAFGKLWICCGTKSVKLEYYANVPVLDDPVNPVILDQNFNLTENEQEYIKAYQVGINRPTQGWVMTAVDQLFGNIPVLDSVTAPMILDTPSAQLPFVGTLPAGTYQIMVSYARRVGGSIVLYSEPTDLGSVDVAAGQVIKIEATASTDPQVTEIVVWVCEPNGATYYFYGSAPNTTDTITIIGSSGKNVFLLMSIEAAPNQLPPALSGWLSFDGRIFAWQKGNNNLYYSMQAQNVFDLERWSTAFYIPTIPFSILSLHVCANNLYVNTVAGLYVITDGDVTAKPVAVTATTTVNSRQIYFQFPDTICEYTGLLIGLTNDGFRIFDGTRFTNDLSRDIKPLISTVMQMAMNNGLSCQPAGTVYRRDMKRTEYQLSYCDGTAQTQNMRLAVNLDALLKSLGTNLNAGFTMTSAGVAWELNQGGFYRSVIADDNTLILAQNRNAGRETPEATIVSENGVADQYCFTWNGDFAGEVRPKECRVNTKAFTSGLWGLDFYQRVYILATANIGFDVNMVLLDNGAAEMKKVQIIGKRNVPVLDSSDMPMILDQIVLPDTTPRSYCIKMPANAKSNQMQLVFSQTANDPFFEVYNIEIYGQHEVNLFT